VKFVMHALGIKHAPVILTAGTVIQQVTRHCMVNVHWTLHWYDKQPDNDGQSEQVHNEREH